VAAALGEVLSAATAGAVTVFERPPATFNVPAIIVADPTRVAYGLPTFGMDQATLSVVCAAGGDEVDYLDGLIATVVTALKDAATLGGVVQACWVKEQSNWRMLTVGGAEYRAADVVLEITM
jgi:hypothetical protein